MELRVTVRQVPAVSGVSLVPEDYCLAVGTSGLGTWFGSVPKW